MNDIDWMKQAVDLAKKAYSLGEVPVGAILVSENNTLVGQGYNQVISKNDPSAHAEILALREAGHTLGNYRLEHSTLYVTLEPCCMCAGAMVHARIQRVVFACRDFRAGAAGSVYNLLKGSPLNHQVWIDEGFLQEECAHLLKDFFRQRR